MKMTRWEPFRDTDDFCFRGTMPGLFGRWPRLLGANDEALEWSPATDISETNEEYLVMAELPGVKRQNVRVRLDQGILTIEGEREHEKQESGNKKHRIERFYGAFCRRFTLPEDADAGNIRAETKDGILTVHIPRLEVAAPKAVEIRVN